MASSLSECPTTNSGNTPLLSLNHECNEIASLPNIDISDMGVNSNAEANERPRKELGDEVLDEPFGLVFDAKEKENVEDSK